MTKPRESSNAPLIILALLALSAVVLFLLVWRIRDGVPDFDEYATIWFSDPLLPVGKLYMERWAVETNPPLYYLLVWVARHFVAGNVEQLRLIHVPIFLLVAAYLIFSALKCKNRSHYLAAMALIYVSSGTCFQYLPELRSYFMQFSLATAACATLVLLADKAVELRRLHFLVLTISMLLLLNLHFTGALLAGLLLAGGMAEALLIRRTGLAAAFFAIGLAGSLPEILFIASNAAVLSGRGQIFWTRTSTQDALLIIWTVIKGTPARNLVFLAAAAWGAVLAGAGRIAGGEKKDCVRVILTQGGAAVIFFAILLAINAERPIITIKYMLEAGAPLASVLCAMAEPVLRRYRFGLLLASANAALAILPFVLHPVPGLLLQAKASRTMVAALARQCPTTKVYGLYMAPHAIESYLAINIYQTLYLGDAQTAGFAISPYRVTAPWSPARDSTCPTILWAEHAPERHDIHTKADFAKLFSLRLAPPILEAASFRVPNNQGMILVLPAR